MRTLSRAECERYAHKQIEAAKQILARHRPGANGWCSCGKQLPCTVAEHATATRERYQSKLALLDATKVLPVLAPPVDTRRVLRWRRMLGGQR